MPDPSLAKSSPALLSGWRLPLLALGGWWLALGALLTRIPQIYDNDSYYHLAIARWFAQVGPRGELPWARFSAMHEGFGDKEILFHLLLAPFAVLPDPVLGGQIFLSLLLAAILTTMGVLVRPVLGGIGFLLPGALLLTSTEVVWRMVRLRPELLALLLFLWGLWSIGTRRLRLLLPIGFCFALGYTAFHAFLGLCGLQFLFLGLARRRWLIMLPLYPALGVGLGLVLHPHFPDNLRIWVLQSFDFFQAKAALDVGTEIFPNTTDVTLMVNLGWLLLMAVLWRSSAPAETSLDERRRLASQADAFLVAATVFGVLYLLMSRFSIYFFVFATSWIVLELGRRGLRPGRTCRLPFRGELRTAVAVALCLLVAAPEARRQVLNYRHRLALGPDEVRLRDREDLAKALPPGARAVARWQQTPIYMLWAPHATYMNVLDPVFMARPYPQLFELQQRIFAGTEPDVPVKLKQALDSDFIAFSRAADTGKLRQRLLGDPRIVARHQQSNELYEVVPGNADLVLDWHLVPADVQLPVDPSGDWQQWPRYPRLRDPELAGLDGFVDGRRLLEPPGDGCLAVVRPAGDLTVIEIAPWGPTQMWLDDALVFAQRSTGGAILGEGVQLLLRSDQESILTVQTCTTSDREPFGFYLRRLVPTEHETATGTRQG